MRTQERCTPPSESWLDESLPVAAPSNKQSFTWNAPWGEFSTWENVDEGSQPTRIPFKVPPNTPLCGGWAERSLPLTYMISAAIPMKAPSQRGSTLAAFVAPARAPTSVSRAVGSPSPSKRRIEAIHVARMPNSSLRYDRVWPPRNYL